MLIDCPRRGNSDLASMGFVAKDFLISIECSISPSSSAFVNCEMFMKCFPASDVPVDIVRDGTRHERHPNLLIFKGNNLKVTTFVGCLQDLECSTRTTVQYGNTLKLSSNIIIQSSVIVGETLDL